MHEFMRLRTGYLFSNWLPHIFQIAECILNGLPTSWGNRAHSAYRWPCNSSEKMWKALLQEFTFVVKINFASINSVKKCRHGSVVFMKRWERERGSAWMWCAQGCCGQKRNRSPAPGPSNYIWAPINQFVWMCVCVLQMRVFVLLV